MKLKHLASTVILLAALFPISMTMGCSDELIQDYFPANNVDLYLDISLSDGHTIAPQGGSKSVSVKSNTTWNVSIDNGDNTSWIHVGTESGTTASGNGDGSFMVYAELNTSGKPRAHTLTIKGANKNEQVEITQDSYSFITNPRPGDELRLKKSGGEETIKVTSNIDWIVKLEGGLTNATLSHNPEDENGDKGITLTYGINDSGSTREGKLTFFADDKTTQLGTIKLIQESIDKSVSIELQDGVEMPLTVPAKGDMIDITVSCISGWELITKGLKGASCDIDQCDGKSADVKVTVKPNYSHDNGIPTGRNIELIFRNSLDSQITETLAIFQEACKRPEFKDPEIESIKTSTDKRHYDVTVRIPYIPDLETLNSATISYGLSSNVEAVIHKDNDTDYVTAELPYLTPNSDVTITVNGLTKNGIAASEATYTIHVKGKIPSGNENNPPMRPAKKIKQIAK